MFLAQACAEQYTQLTRKNHSVVLLAILKLEINDHLITHTQSSASRVPRHTLRAQIRLNETNNLARVSNRKSERRNSERARLKRTSSRPRRLYRVRQ